MRCSLRYNNWTADSPNFAPPSKTATGLLSIRYLHKPRRCVMLWEVEIAPKGADPEAKRVCEEFNLLTHSDRGAGIVAGSARGYLLEGDLDRAQVERLLTKVLV